MAKIRRAKSTWSSAQANQLNQFMQETIEAFTALRRQYVSVEEKSA